MQPVAERRAIEAMGRVLGPAVLAGVHDLYREAQDRHAAVEPIAAADLAYGPDPRHRLDLYLPAGRSGGPVPVVLWVHGGGFLRGEKASSEHPFNAHAGRWAARNGMIGAVMNYRLAPDHMWPTGGEDVGLAIDWLRINVAAQGDPARIFAFGTSAGATHVATHLRLRAENPGIAGAILLSGLYGFAPLDERDTLYYGAPELYPGRWPREAMVETATPLLLACAEFDPPRFQQESLGLLAARLERHGQLPRFFYGSGHNHFSMAYHLGTADTRLADEVLAFIGDPA